MSIFRPKKIVMSLNLSPKGQRRPRFARVGKFVRTYKDKRQESHENKLLALMLPYAPKTPWTGAIKLRVETFFAIPQSWPKWKKELADEMKIYPASKPDASNILKNIEDVMSGIFFQDDAQLVEVHCWKFYSDTPKIIVEMEEIGDGSCQ